MKVNVVVHEAPEACWERDYLEEDFADMLKDA